MDLVSGSPIWLHGRPAETAPGPTLRHDRSCEIAILGAGITGALLADRLAADRRDVVVVDRHWRAHGSTAACTALVEFEIDLSLLDLGRALGEAHAVAAYRSSYRAAKTFAEAIVPALHAPVDFTRRASLYVASTAKDAEELEREAAARRVAGIEGSWISAGELRCRYGIDCFGAIRSETAAVVNPVALTCALLARAERHGAAVYEGVTIDTIDTGAHGVALVTAHGPVVQARHIVFASGYEAVYYLPANTASLKSTYAFASRPVPRDRLWGEEALLWETARPYLYARTTPDARVLVGGADDDFHDPARRAANLPTRIEQVRRAFAEWLPGLELEVETSWAGTFAETQDGLPYIGPSPSRPNATFALGYGGNGITFSVLAAEILGEHLAGREHPDEWLYRFGR